jgi:dUTP pyrophosphatase
MGRFFVVAKGWEDKKINLPQRQTVNAAGYDFEAAETVIVPPIWRTVLLKLQIKPIKVHTGIKVRTNPDEALFVYNRSSNPINRFLLLSEGVGVVDADYFENPTNDGEITFSFWNFGLTEMVIKKGERIGQGVFKKYLVVDNDDKPTKTRTGGRGSTGTE